MMGKLKVGFAMCGSYCTYESVMKEVERLSKVYDLFPIMSENSSVTDTRFGEAKAFREKLTTWTGKDIIDNIHDAEPIGPKKLLDVLVIAPCTGNTIAKLANGITDTAVTLATKAHLRNGRPVVIAVSTNDGLSGNAKNVGELMARKNMYFVPFRQDAPTSKPTSIVADFTLIEDTIEKAILGEQIEPVILGR
jgi:dipicolinate synthase subunit B